jgi:hypothetical protein
LERRLPGLMGRLRVEAMIVGLRPSQGIKSSDSFGTFSFKEKVLADMPEE